MTHTELKALYNAAIVELPAAQWFDEGNQCISEDVLTHAAVAALILALPRELPRLFATIEALPDEVSLLRDALEQVRISADHDDAKQIATDALSDETKVQP